MRIAAVEVTLHERPLPPLERRGPAPGQQLVNALLRIVTDDGTEGCALLGSMLGWGETLGAQVVHLLTPRLLGRDPLDIGAIWADLWHTRLADPQAIGAVDVALWDLAGKTAGLPVHRLLGTHRSEAPAYFSSWYYTDVERYVDEALRLRDEGWTAYKLHPFCDAERDIALAGRVRDAVGDSMTLMLDPHGAYSYAEALRVADALHGLAFAWLEDPLGTHDLYTYRKLCEKSRIPIIATECTTGAHRDYTAWITERATDALRGDVALKGGITPLVRIGHLADAFGLPLEIHDGFNAVGNVANLHVNLASANAGRVEILSVDVPGRVSLDAFHWGLLERLDITAGVVRAPEGPGLGVELDHELLARTQVARLS